jgi:hypothetical protein
VRIVIDFTSWGKWTVDFCISTKADLHHCVLGLCVFIQWKALPHWVRWLWISVLTQWQTFVIAYWGCVLLCFYTMTDLRHCVLGLCVAVFLHNESPYHIGHVGCAFLWFGGGGNHCFSIHYFGPLSSILTWMSNSLFSSGCRCWWSLLLKHVYNFKKCIY